jgi:hypothetical protein
MDHLLKSYYFSILFDVLHEKFGIGFALDCPRKKRSLLSSNNTKSEICAKYPEWITMKSQFQILALNFNPENTICYSISGKIFEMDLQRAIKFCGRSAFYSVKNVCITDLFDEFY